MRKLMIGQLIMYSALAACSRATAAVPDANDDLDCAVITYQFLEESQGRVDERHEEAVRAVASWYAAKMQKRAEASGKTMEEVLMPGAKLLAAVQRNPRAFRTISRACAHRATEDPHFDEFVGGER